MRVLFLSLVVGISSLGLTTATPSRAMADGPAFYGRNTVAVRNWRGGSWRGGGWRGGSRWRGSYYYPRYYGGYYYPRYYSNYNPGYYYAPPAYYYSPGYYNPGVYWGY